jgi:hypothetical protein
LQKAFRSNSGRFGVKKWSFVVKMT